jgi:hypothetical protein
LIVQRIVQRLKHKVINEKRKNSQKLAFITVNGKRYGSRCFNKLARTTFLWMKRSNFMSLRAFEKFSVKTPNVLIKKWRFSLILRYFLER